MLGEEEQDLSGVGMEMPPKVRTPGSLFCLQPQACAGRRRGGNGLCNSVCVCVCVCARAQDQVKPPVGGCGCQSDTGTWFSDECD